MTDSGRQMSCCSCDRDGVDYPECPCRCQRATPPPPVATPSEDEPRTGTKCINCGEAEDGGYCTDEGECGPFCSHCWAALEDQFATTPAPLVMEGSVDYRPPPVAGSLRESVLALVERTVSDDNDELTVAEAVDGINDLFDKSDGPDFKAAWHASADLAKKYIELHADERTARKAAESALAERDRKIESLVARLLTVTGEVQKADEELDKAEAELSRLRSQGTQARRLAEERLTTAVLFDIVNATTQGRMRMRDVILAALFPEPSAGPRTGIE